MKRFAAFCRNLRALVVAAVAGSTGAQAQAPPDPDAAAWEAARAAGTAAACQRYLEDFPTGRHVEEAFRCIVEQTIPGAGPPESAIRRDDIGGGCEIGGATACLFIPEPPAPPAPAAGPAPAITAPAPPAPAAELY